jgi:hypothetical protein
MNIKKIDVNEEAPNTHSEIWERIFQKQKELIEKYKEIEDMGDLMETLEQNIYTRVGQKWIKDFAWRTTEELCEAQEAFELFTVLDKNNPNYESTGKQFYDHYLEEYIDALHFLVELTIIAGESHDIVPSFDDDSLGLEKSDIELIEKVYIPFPIIYNLGLMCNTLKNKPWKQTEVLTDDKMFYKYLKNAWLSMMLSFYIIFEKDEKRIFEYYFKKHAVNKFRQRSNY